MLASSPAAPAADPPSNPGITPAAMPATGEGRAYTTVAPLVVEQQADVVAERDGRITAVKADVGDHVRRGEVLALLDDRALQAVRAEKAAKVDSLRAQMQTLATERTGKGADLRRAEAMRYKADEAVAQAELRAADVELAQTHVTAPFDGVVGRRSVHEAQAVKKGDALFWITAQAPLRIIFAVPESDMAFFSRGSKLELTTADYPHLKQPASVSRVSPVVDRASGSIEVIGNLERPSALLKPGMSMQVKLSSR